MARRRSGFWDSFNKGYSAGEHMWNAQAARAEQDAIRGVMDETPYAQSQFSEADAETLRGLGATHDIDYRDGKYIATPQGGGDAQEFTPGQRWGLGTQFYDTKPTEQQVDAYRTGRVADIISARDPARGLQMRTQAHQLQRQMKDDARREVIRGREDAAYERESQGRDAIQRTRMYSPEAYNATMSRLNELGPEGEAARGLYKQHFSTTRSQSMRNAADELMGLGRMDDANAMLARAELVTKEGFADVAKAARVGVSGDALTSIFNGTGEMRIDRVISNEPVMQQGKQVDREIKFVKDGKEQSIRLSTIEENVVSPEKLVELRQRAEDAKAMRDLRLEIAQLGRAGGAGGKQGQPLGMTDDGKFIVPDGKGGFTTQPVMIDGKPATPDQINMFKKLHGLGGQPSPFDARRKALLEGKMQGMTVQDPRDPNKTVTLDQSQALDYLDKQEASWRATQQAAQEFSAYEAEAGRSNAVAKFGRDIQKSVKDSKERLRKYHVLGLTDEEIDSLELRPPANSAPRTGEQIGAALRRGIVEVAPRIPGAVMRFGTSDNPHSPEKFFRGLVRGGS